MYGQPSFFYLCEKQINMVLQEEIIAMEKRLEALRGYL
jgi:hypothetical protein